MFIHYTIKRFSINKIARACQIVTKMQRFYLGESFLREWVPVIRSRIGLLDIAFSILLNKGKRMPIEGYRNVQNCDDAPKRWLSDHLFFEKIKGEQRPEEIIWLIQHPIEILFFHKVGAFDPLNKRP